MSDGSFLLTRQKARRFARNSKHLHAAGKPLKFAPPPPPRPTQEEQDCGPSICLSVEITNRLPRPWALLDEDTQTIDISQLLTPEQMVQGAAMAGVALALKKARYHNLNLSTDVCQFRTTRAPEG